MAESSTACTAEQHVHVFRLCREEFKALDGGGGRLYGGRWDSPGRPMVYASSTLALAALEYLVHLDAADAPSDLVALTIDVPNDLTVRVIDASRLPAGWQVVSGSRAGQRLGDAWLTSRATAVLQVPAAPVPDESNILLNPAHPDAARIKTVRERPFSFDPRLLG